MTPARRTLITAAVLLLTLVIFLRYDGSKTLGRTRATLPDGTVLTVETLTFGATHQFTADRSWMGRLRRTLPPPLRRFIAANGPSAMTTTRSNSVVVWLTADHPRPAQQLGGVNQLQIQFELADEHGCVARSVGRGCTGSGSFTVNFPMFETFPRRSPVFKLRVRDAHDTLLAEFDLPNPARGPFPNWVPEPLPIARTNGELTFLLKELTCSGAGTQLSFNPSFEVFDRGRPTVDWNSNSVTYLDPTGNSSDRPFCTNEAVWKLAVEFFRTDQAAFQAGETLRLGNLPVPAADALVTLTNTAQIAGTSLEVIAFGGAGQFTFSNSVPVRATDIMPGHVIMTSSSSSGGGDSCVLSRSSTNLLVIDRLSIIQSHAWLLLKVSALPAGARLLVRGRDDQGGKSSSSVSSSVTWGPGGYIVASLNLPNQTRRLSLEVIVNRSRSAEYIVARPRESR